MHRPVGSSQHSFLVVLVKHSHKGSDVCQGSIVLVVLVKLRSCTTGFGNALLSSGRCPKKGKVSWLTSIVQLLGHVKAEAKYFFFKEL